MPKKTLCLIIALALFHGAVAWGEPCATHLRGKKGRGFDPAPPASRTAVERAPRAAVPIPFENADHLATEHFQLIWGLDYDRTDPDWQAVNGVPAWIALLAESLEHAYAQYTSMGYPPPYGSENWFLDVYIANTGARVYSTETGSYKTIALTADYYAYTEIDRDYGVAYFLFNDDFSAHTQDELNVLKAVAAHELFHAVQRAAGYPWDAESPLDGPEYIDEARWREEGWWFEGSATWMEEEIFPEVNDYALYVRAFLANPALALNSTSGTHVYGSSIFAGFVRFMAPGQESLLEVLSRAYPLGVEGALREVTGKYAGGTLEASVAKFWSQAAHPADLWPDGNLYLADGAPKITAQVTQLPATLAPAGGKAPGRFGATLYTIDQVALPADAVLFPEDENSAFTLASSTSAVDSAVFTGGRASLQPGQEGRKLYLAVVNTSPGPGTKNFALSLDAPSTSGNSPRLCFIETLLGGR